jgi:hypothetical protein
MSLTILSLGRKPAQEEFGKRHPGWGRECRKQFFTVYAGVDYNLTLCRLQSRLQHFYHGRNPMPESTLNLRKSRLIPPVRDFGFGLCPLPPPQLSAFIYLSPNFKLLRNPKINSEELIPPRCVACMAGRYDHPIPTRFLWPP